MGCAVEITDTGVEVEVHVFDTKAAAEQYVTRSRRYVLTLSYGTDDPRNAFEIYTGAIEGECASIRRTPRGETWRACFWIEGDVKVESVGAYEGKPTWHGLYRIRGGEWVRACNSNGDALAYASADAALAGAKVMLGEVQRNTVKGN